MSETESRPSRWRPALVIVVLLATLLLVLSVTTFPGQFLLWQGVATVAHVFEQDYGRPDAPLNRAALSWNWKEFEALVQDRAQRKEAGFPRLTAMLAAESGGNTLLVLLIDKHKFDVNQRIRDHSPKTAIDFAAANGRADTVDLLLARGAKLHVSKEIGEDTVLWKLATREANDERGRHDAIRIAKLLVERGEDVRATRRDGPDPLYAAIESKFPEMVELLLKNGASASTATGWRGSPLSYAEKIGCEECKKHLATASAHQPSGRIVEPGAHLR